MCIRDRDMIHYDVQLFGGVVLHQGKIAEMATGEGKTLVATLPVFLNALAKKGCLLYTSGFSSMAFSSTMRASSAAMKSAICFFSASLCARSSSLVSFSIEG